MNKAWIGAICALFVLASAAPTFGAPVANAGLSGQCYDHGGDGGQGAFNATVYDNGSSSGPAVQFGPSLKNLEDPAFTQAWATSIVHALAQFGQGTQDYGAGNDACTNTNGNATSPYGHIDYIEVHGNVSGNFVQVCYNHIQGTDTSGNPGSDQGVHVYNSSRPDCPTSPGGYNPTQDYSS